MPTWHVEQLRHKNAVRIAIAPILEDHMGVHAIVGDINNTVTSVNDEAMEHTLTQALQRLPKQLPLHVWSAWASTPHVHCVKQNGPEHCLSYHTPKYTTMQASLEQICHSIRFISWISTALRCFLYLIPTWHHDPSRCIFLCLSLSYSSLLDEFGRQPLEHVRLCFTVESCSSWFRCPHRCNNLLISQKKKWRQG